MRLRRRRRSSARPSGGPAGDRRARRPGGDDKGAPRALARRRLGPDPGLVCPGDTCALEGGGGGGGGCSSVSAGLPAGPGRIWTELRASHLLAVAPAAGALAPPLGALAPPPGPARLSGLARSPKAPPPLPRPRPHRPRPRVRSAAGLVRRTKAAALRNHASACSPRPRRGPARRIGSVPESPAFLPSHRPRPVAAPPMQPLRFLSCIARYGSRPAPWS